MDDGRYQSLVLTATLEEDTEDDGGGVTLIFSAWHEDTVTQDYNEYGTYRAGAGYFEK